MDRDNKHADPRSVDPKSVVEVRDLIVHYETPVGVVEAVNNISFTIGQGETLGLVGETGAGKTTVALSIMRLLPTPPSRVIQGEIYLNGQNLAELSEKQMRKVRGKQVSLIFQDPMSALNPVQRVGDQVAEVIRLHQHMGKAQAYAKALEMLETVGIAASRAKDFPHQFSGGMKQRVVIAIALACQPELIIADEPTTALDVTIQAQVLELMKALRVKFNTSVLLITHDFGVVAEMCDKCAVMYAGEIVEYGTVEHIFRNPQHPYTKGLFASLPDLESDAERLQPIVGLMPNPMALPHWCSFADRCSCATEACRKRDSILIETEPGHFVKCIRFEQNKEA
jgi:peptide/nickel transport system ATP-binding protein